MKPLLLIRKKAKRLLLHVASHKSTFHFYPRF